MASDSPPSDSLASPFFVKIRIRSDSVFRTRGRKMHLPKVLSNKYQSLKRKLKWKVQPSFQLTFIYFRNIAFMSNELTLMICTISLDIILMVKSYFWFYENIAWHFCSQFFFCYLKKANRAIWFKNTLPVYCHVDQMSEKIKLKKN